MGEKSLENKERRGKCKDVALIVAYLRSCKTRGTLIVEVLLRLNSTLYPGIRKAV